MASTESETKQTPLTEEELAHRVAVMKRFRELLLEQRNRFQEYLVVLDKQKDVIEKGDTDALLSHVELEEKIVSDIFAIQKVIDPLEDLYRASYPERETEVPKLKAALEELKHEAVQRSQRNRNLLSERMEKLRSEIKTLRNNPFAARRSVYDNSGAASLIDIKG
ncbi:flagellar export chaperone FlgN [Gracilinema caldarium]|uniref:FlgN family protein n=1 Tax=Gracilinema caldarium (strain ATCC 51460 / DSM 7334 / H1) TaxID=744872 RepID=F8EYN8_GRAC1|nr:flagellar export chaperone FlgN [Gracilinema caldarium]AEJ18615.1 FlgN family protein [Gracilinema caldarium DSM 7334]